MVETSIVQTFQPKNLAFKTGNFVYHNWRGEEHQLYVYLFLCGLLDYMQLPSLRCCPRFIEQVD